jgi:hypothetical protein
MELPNSTYGRARLKSHDGIFEHEFLGSATAALAGWPFNVALNSGTLAKAAGSAGHPGVLQFSTAASNVAAPIIFLYQSDMVFGLGDAYECGWLIQSPANLSDGTDTYTIFAGFGDTSTNALSTDAAYITYTHSVNSGRWTGFTSSNGAATQMTSLNASVMATSTWYKLVVKVNPLGNKVEFYVNDTYIGYCIANIPTGVARALGPMLQIVKSAGTTARTFLVDWYYHEIGILTARY